MGITEKMGLATLVEASGKTLLWNVPDNWTLEDAATVPVVYSTVRNKICQLLESKNGLRRSAKFFISAV